MVAALSQQPRHVLPARPGGAGLWLVVLVRHAITSSPPRTKVHPGRPLTGGTGTSAERCDWACRSHCYKRPPEPAGDARPFDEAITNRDERAADREPGTPCRIFAADSCTFHAVATRGIDSGARVHAPRLLRPRCGIRLRQGVDRRLLCRGRRLGAFRWKGGVRDPAARRRPLGTFRTRATRSPTSRPCACSAGLAGPLRPRQGRRDPDLASPGRRAPAAGQDAEAVLG